MEDKAAYRTAVEAPNEAALILTFQEEQSKGLPQFVDAKVDMPGESQWLWQRAFWAASSVTRPHCLG